MTQLVFEVSEDLGKQKIRPGQVPAPRLGALRGKRKVGVRMLHPRPKLTGLGKPFPRLGRGLFRG